MDDEEVLAAGNMTAVARCLRAFHDASVGFEGETWQWPAHEPAEVICHMAAALVKRDGRET